MSECISDKISFSCVVDDLNGFTCILHFAQVSQFISLAGRKFHSEYYIITFHIFSLTSKCADVWCHLIKCLPRFSLVRIACSCLPFTMYKSLHFVSVRIGPSRRIC